MSFFMFDNSFERWSIITIIDQTSRSRAIQEVIVDILHAHCNWVAVHPTRCESSHLIMSDAVIQLQSLRPFTVKKSDAD